MGSQRFFLACSSAIVIAFLAACGGHSVTAGSVVAVATSAETPDVAGVPSYEGNPGDLLTLSNYGEAEHVVQYESYEQMRDYSDVMVVATLASLEVEQAKPDEVLSGALVATFRPEHVIGGQSEPRLVGNSLEVTLRLDGDASTTAAVLDRMQSLMGEASYLLFLNRALPGPAGEHRYTPNIHSGLNGVLAFWPGDGRLSPVTGQNDLAVDAIKRGEAKTGTSDVPQDLGSPTFEGPPPIGLQVDELRRTFALPVGRAHTAPPHGWDRYQAILDRALGE